MLEQVGRFEIKGELGRGGMGAVYRAWDPELQREVAIKAMEFPPAAPGDDGEANRERFLREARTAARLTHPNIVAVYDVLRVADTAYIVMEIIRGSSLEAKLRAGKALDAAVTERALREAADGLDFAHRNGIVHRDIKPANILLDESGRVKLVDFGIARLIDQATASANLTAPGTTVGTLGYMPPEQIRGDPVDGRADQFSLGVVAYQMAAGRKPFEADTWIAVTHKIMNVEPDPVTKWNPAVKPEAAASIAKALSKMPDERFITCGEFARTFSGEVKLQARKRSLVPMVAAGGLVVALGTAAALWVHCCAAPPLSETAKQPTATEMKTPETKAVPPATAEIKSMPPVVPLDLTKLTIGSATIEFAAIQPGRFTMGGVYDDNEKPEHRVSITRPFQIAKTEVTRKQWHAVMGGPSPSLADADLPKMAVSYNDALAFAQKLNGRGDGFRYRLPTEAEWEYAARAGNRGELYGKLDDIAWYNDGSVEAPTKVASKDPNAWGLYDMIGNAAEWVSDWYGEDYYRSSPAENPTGPATGQYRGVRGGAYATQPMTLRVSYRYAAEPNLRGEIYGFRLVREAAR